eukprot:gene33225-40199_t
MNDRLDDLIQQLSRIEATSAEKPPAPTTPTEHTPLPTPPAHPPAKSSQTPGEIDQAPSYFCQICQESHPFQPKSEDDPLPYTLLTCHHTYCRECLKNYMENKVNDGQVYMTCFHAASSPGGPLVLPGEGEVKEEPTSYGDEKLDLINKHDIYTVLGPHTIEKYEKFVFAKEHKYVRECPHCRTHQVCFKDEGARDNKIKCIYCEKLFCYVHSNAHDWDVYATCEDYENSLQAVNQASMSVIEVSTMPCPKCGVRVQKISGCNHMKCQCGASFCWLCGQQVDDSIFPAHFQWWNPNGCANLQ